MEVKTEDKKVDTNVKIKKKENSKVYFFIIAIAALLLTNVYFYVKYKSSGEKLYTVALQKEKLQREIDRIEAELDNMQNIREFAAVESEEIIEREQRTRAMIASLREDLEENNLAASHLATPEQEVLTLKGNVTARNSHIGGLKLQNEILRPQNRPLANPASNNASQIQRLEASNR